LIEELNEDDAQKIQPYFIEVGKFDKKDWLTKKIKKQIHEDAVKYDKLTPYELSRLAFPQRWKKQGEEKQFSKFLDVFRSLKMDLPFVEALEAMLIYAKFIKEILSKKRKLQKDETVALIVECSAIIQRKLPQKLWDPRSFTIPCVIGNVKVDRALCDLGATINLMPP
jgi:hypothetical protein